MPFDFEFKEVRLRCMSFQSHISEELS